MSQLTRASKTLPALALLGLAALSLSGCKKEKAPAIDPNVVAIVNGEPITRADFEKELTRELRSIEPVDPQSPEQVEPYRKALLDEMIHRTLLLQAARKVNLVASPEEVDRRVMRISADYPAEQFEEALAQGQLSIGELKRKTAASVIVERLFEEHVYPRVAVTEEEIRQYYEEHKADFDEPEQVRAAQIIVRTLEEARKIQQLLRGGKKFPDLARKYSLSADARVGGDLGFFRRGVMPPAFDEVCFKLAVNQVSDVVTTEYGFHLFKVLERRPPAKRELGEVRRQVEQTILKLKQADAQRNYVAKLHAESQITINEPVLQAITGRNGTKQ